MFLTNAKLWRKYITIQNTHYIHQTTGAYNDFIVLLPKTCMYVCMYLPGLRVTSSEERTMSGEEWEGPQNGGRIRGCLTAADTPLK